MLQRIGTIAVLGVLATCVPAIAAPATVNLRVEGETQTYFEGPVATDARVVTTAAGGSHMCDGTNNGASNPTGPTQTTALEDAEARGGFDWDGRYGVSGYDDFFIERIGTDGQVDPPTFGDKFWSTYRNRDASDVGGCQERVSNGDEVLILWQAFGQPVLELSGPAKAATGQAFGVTVRQHDGNVSTSPAPGASVQGQTTDAGGNASISFADEGLKRFKATRADAVRSNALEVCVSSDGQGDCAGQQPAGAGGTLAGGGSPVAGDSVAPDSLISGLRNGSRMRRGPRLFRGRASDDVGLLQVYLRLRRIARGGCRWFSFKRETFSKPRTCRRARFGRLGSEERWSYLMPERLGPGRYILELKVLDRAFNADREKVRFRVLG